jgi:hypothetical protein
VAEISAQGWSRVSDDRLRAAFDAINAEVGAR